MTALTIRRLDPKVKESLRLRAARRGHSMEEEARRILTEACGGRALPPANAWEALRRPFQGLGGVEFELPKRSQGREPPDFA